MQQLQQMQPQLPQPSAQQQPTQAVQSPQQMLVPASNNPAIGLTAPPPKPQIGEASYHVERMPEVKACNSQPTAKLASTAPSTEVYTIQCSGGDVLMVRCEFRSCRVLR